MRWFTMFSIYRPSADLSSAMMVPVCPWREKKTPPSDEKEELMTAMWSLVKNEKEGGLSPLSTFPLIIKL